MSGMVKRWRVGERIGRNLTVLATVDAKPRRHPILIVWNHASWCPMACKLFRTAKEAEEEGRILNALAHPNIVQQFGTTPQGALLLDFLEGPTLAHVVDDPDRRFSTSDALRVAGHIGSAIHHMHGKGYVHLDLSPSNIIVAGSRPVLIDFGTARDLAKPRPRHVIGTDAYIAPEECLLQPVTPAADVFGLGVLLFELLAGRKPFPRGTRRKPFPQIDRPAAPIRELRKSVPKALEQLLAACLARDPAQRPTLPDLLPRLNGMIRSGGAMWPAGFSPAAAA